VLLEQTLAIVHACLAQAFFALAVSLALFTSDEWRKSSPKVDVPDAGRLQRLCLITTGLVYVQVIFGAVLRHTGEMLALHLIFSTIVAVHVVLLGARIFKRHPDRQLLRPISLLSGLLLAQIILGAAAYMGKFVMALPDILAITVRTSHVVVGSLMLATSLVLALRSFKLFSRGGLPQERKFSGVGAARRAGEISA
jgi:cytochrome c oxidase assembly protein subunit 15